MNRPYIICHMMTSIDGRVDCAMTAKLRGVDDYYATPEALNAPTTVSGRHTAELELALHGTFKNAQSTPAGRDCFYKEASAAGYNVIVDSRGQLLWPDQSAESRPLLVITSRRASTAYLEYLRGLHASYIVAGETQCDLKAASAVLFREFKVERMTVVGGPIINGAFLKAGLLDEVTLLMGPGIDGRSSEQGVFEGLPPELSPVALNFKSVKALHSGALFVSYTL